MSIRKIALVAALGTSLASAPVVAQTAALPSQPVRAAATLDQANGQWDGASTETYIVAFFALLAIGAGLYFAFVDDDEDAPVSP
jgi:hypothetical protein